MLDPALSLMRVKRPKPSAGRESRTNLAIAFAVYRAARTGGYVPV